MAELYRYPPPITIPPEALAALKVAVRSFGINAALRIEDVGAGLSVFRGRYRIGKMEPGPLPTSEPRFIEFGAGGSFALAIEDAKRRA